MTTLPVVTRILAAPFAALAPMDAAVAGAAGMASEAKFWLIVALVAASVVIWATRVIRRREAVERRRMADGRAEWFASFHRSRLVRQARP